MAEPGGLTFAVKDTFVLAPETVLLLTDTLTSSGWTKMTVDAVTDVPDESIAVTVGVYEPSSPYTC